MNGASTAAAATTDAFASAMEKAAAMTRYLGSQQSFAATHSELESFVAEEGRELLRRMLQGHHELRALAEQPVRVEGADRVLRRFLRPSGRPVLSIVGRVDIGRFAYQARGVDGLHPMDAALNLPPELQQKYPGNHVNWWTKEKVHASLTRAGFSNVYVSAYGQSFAAPLRDTNYFDNTQPRISFYVEATK
jgi:hypothetical protein